MNAEYTTSLLYPGNPYVEALPPMLAGQELIRALAFPSRNINLSSHSGGSGSSSAVTGFFKTYFPTTNAAPVRSLTYLSYSAINSAICV